jgi:hypothetical protein
MTDTEAAQTAIGLAYAYWQALSIDDDAALPPICFYGFLQHHGGPGPGIAERMRLLWGLEREQCAHMGVTNVVRVLDDGGLIAVGLQPSGLGLQMFTEPTLVRQWSLLIYPTAEDMVRRIYGGADMGELGPRIVRTIQLEIDIPATGPLQ